MPCMAAMYTIIEYPMLAQVDSRMTGILFRSLLLIHLRPSFMPKVLTNIELMMPSDRKRQRNSSASATMLEM